MNNICRVQEIDATEEIIEDNQNLIVTEFFGSLRREQFLQVKVDIVDDHEDLIECFQGAVFLSLLFWNDNVM